MASALLPIRTRVEREREKDKGIGKDEASIGRGRHVGFIIGGIYYNLIWG